MTRPLASTKDRPANIEHVLGSTRCGGSRYGAARMTCRSLTWSDSQQLDRETPDSFADGDSTQPSFGLQAIAVRSTTRRGQIPSSIRACVLGFLLRETGRTRGCCRVAPPRQLWRIDVAP